MPIGRFDKIRRQVQGWDESEHPRESDGKFTAKGGGSSSSATTKYRPLIDGVTVNKLSDLQEKPSRSRVIEIGKILELDYSQVPFELDLSEENLSLPASGMTDEKGIVIFASAFATTKLLVKTIAHEYYHYMHRTKGFAQDRQSIINEEEAFAFDAKMWEKYEEESKK